MASGISRCASLASITSPESGAMTSETAFTGSTSVQDRLSHLRRHGTARSSRS
jgi:hypothetical protein